MNTEDYERAMDLSRANCIAPEWELRMPMADFEPRDLRVELYGRIVHAKTDGGVSRMVTQGGASSANVRGRSDGDGVGDHHDEEVPHGCGHVECGTGERVGHVASGPRAVRRSRRPLRRAIRVA